MNARFIQAGGNQVGNSQKREVDNLNKWHTQSEDSTGAVRVKLGYDRRSGQPVTEFIVVNKSNGAKVHEGYSQKTGDQVFPR